MSDRVLLITDYSGMLHITPVGNRDLYEARNRVNKTLKYGIKEIDEDKALKIVQDNKGVDPAFTAPAEQSKVINTQQEELEKLRKALADKDSENQKLQEQFLALSTASTSDSDYSKEAESQIKSAKSTK